MRKMCFIRRAGYVVLMMAELLVTGCAEQEGATAGPGNQETPKTASIQSASTVRYHAAFTGKEGMAVQGAYRIKDHDGVLRLILDDAFKSDDGPDLHVVLSPVEPGEVSGSTAMAEGKAFVVGKLASLTGNQTYDLPADMDLSAYQSVLIQCIKYAHLYAAAPLE